MAAPTAPFHRANANEIVKQWLDVHQAAFGADVGG